MPFMHLPHSLTEEEELLQQKFLKFRKIKKALLAMKAPKPEPKEKPKEEDLKRKFDAALSNTEQAKKLLKSGAIKVASEKKEAQIFKRSKKQRTGEKSSEKASNFQPFPSTPASDKEEEAAASPSMSASPRDVASRPRPGNPRPEIKNLYGSFRRGGTTRGGYDRREPKKGNTVYVYGTGLTEAIVQKTFNGFGNIVNMSMETEKNCAFVTFQNMEHAEEAITQMHGSMVQGVSLRVSLARRQPTFEPSVHDSTCNSWPQIAASNSQKGNHQDKRDMVIYKPEDDDLFS